MRELFTVDEIDPPLLAHEWIKGINSGIPFGPHSTYVNTYSGGLNAGMSKIRDFHNKQTSDKLLIERCDQPTIKGRNINGGTA